MGVRDSLDESELVEGNELDAVFIRGVPEILLFKS
jgi:hypothetical protein